MAPKASGFCSVGSTHPHGSGWKIHLSIPKFKCFLQNFLQQEIITPSGQILFTVLQLVRLVQKGEHAVCTVNVVHGKSTRCKPTGGFPTLNVWMETKRWVPTKWVSIKRVSTKWLSTWTTLAVQMILTSMDKILFNSWQTLNSKQIAVVRRPALTVELQVRRQMMVQKQF